MAAGRTQGRHARKPDRRLWGTTNRRYQAWQRRQVDRAITYSPTTTGLVTGMIGAFMHVDRWVTAGMVVAGTAVGRLATWWGRRTKEKKDQHAD